VLIPSHNNNHSIQKCEEKKQDGSNGVRASEGYKPIGRNISLMEKSKTI